MATAADRPKTDAERYERQKERSRQRSRDQAREGTTVIIPRCADPERRKRLEADDVAWLMHYFGPDCGLDDPFTYEFTAQQRDMLAAIGHAIKYGGDQAIAASRGEGKTTLTERRVLKSILTGEVNYAVIFASTGQMAEDVLDSIDTALVENVLLLDDYPEVCIPVRELSGAPQRANSQRASGDRHDTGEPYEMAELSYRWCGKELIFPDVPGSPSARAIIATRGLDAAVRGLKKRGKRPRLAIIDDPDTEDTARSEEQAEKLEKRIDAAIGGLGGQRRAVGRVMLTTLQSRVAVSWRYTDDTVKPTFKGRRYRFLIEPPSDPSQADRYVQMRIADLQRKDEQGNRLDPHARNSHSWYVENQAAIEAGAVVSNPNRYENELLPDGSQKEISAVQHYFNLVAKLGKDVVATEYDNDPPEITAGIDTTLTPLQIQRKVNGLDRGIVPKPCHLLTIGVDVRKTELHWVARAWEPDATGHTIHYGIHDVRGTIRGSDEGLDVAIHRAILELVEKIRRNPFTREDGEIVDSSLILIDAGYRTDAVYGACHQAGAGVMPIMGFGKSSGCTQANFAEAQRATIDKRPGDGWFLSRKGKTWLVCADADRWKAWEHDRWLTDVGRPGALLMWGRRSDDPQRLSDDETAHFSYARHILSESEIEEQHKGGLRRRWKSKSHQNHWLDASYYASVAMSIRGVRIEESAPSNAGRSIVNPMTPASRPTLQQMAKGGK